MPSLEVQKRLFNSKWATVKPPSRWTRDPIVKKTYYKHRKKAKRHVVKKHMRGGSFGLQTDTSKNYVGGTYSKHDSQRIFQGNHSTYFAKRVPHKKRRHVDFRGRMALKAGRIVG